MNEGVKTAILHRSNELYRLGSYKEALAEIGDRASEFQGIKPYFLLRALILTALNEHNLAVKDLLEVIKIDPLDPMPYANIGDCLAKNLQFEEAERYFELALTVEEDFFEAIVGLGVVAFQKLDYSACERYFQRASILKPDHPTVLTNLGNCYSVQGKYDEALKLLNKAIARDRNNSLARTNRALIKLGKNQFETGWADYEYRWDSGNFMAQRFQDLPKWEGPSGKPKNVLIWSEQGVGDEIMFGSIFPDLSALDEKFFIECDPRLFNLFRKSFPELDFIPKGMVKNTGPVQAQIPLASLGKIFRKSKADFRNRARSYLHATEKSLVEEAQQALENLPRPWIGVSWESYALTQNFRERKSIHAFEFSTLTNRLNCSLINLQFSNPHKHEKKIEQAIPQRVVTLPGLDLRRDLEGLVTLITQLDGVITIGNSVAHICGALGKKAFVLLPTVPDWRWGHEGSRSVWYQSLELFRNTSESNWDTVFDKLAEKINPFLTDQRQ